MSKKERGLGGRAEAFSSSEVGAPKGSKAFLIRSGEILALSLLPLLVFLIYSNTLEGPFIFDDLDTIKYNPHIRLTNLTLGGISKAAFESPLSDRPVTNISFALNYYFHQYHVFGYHLINILIHITTAIIFYLLLRTTLRLPSLGSRYETNQWIPIITALIWLIHPLQTQSVAFIVQRMNSIAAMFYVLSLLLYVKARLTQDKSKNRLLFGGCILAGILSLGSKPIAATLPFFIFLYEWYFFQDLSWTWLKGRSLLFGGMLILLVIVALMFLGAHPLEKILKTYATRDFTLPQRALTEFRVVIYYMSLIVFPHPSRLNLDHDFPISHSLTDPMTTSLSLGLIAGLIGVAIYMAKRERLLSFCILWFFGNLVIESSVIGLEIIFEHRTYLPSMLAILLAVTLVYRFTRHKWQRVGILSLVVLVFSFWTYERNMVWTDDVTLWRDCAEKSPKKARPHYNLGNALARKGMLDEAIIHYSEAVRIHPDYLEAHYNMANALKRQGRLEEAIGQYSEVVRIHPEDTKAHFSLGVALAKQGKLKEAVGRFSEVLRIDPDNGEAHNNLGVALARQGRLKEAVSHFSEALRIRPDDQEARLNLEQALTLMGRSVVDSNTVLRP